MTERMSLGPWIGISGAFPSREELAAHGWNETNTRLAVIEIVKRVMQSGADIVHGSHPTFTVLIKGCAAPDARPEGPKRVHYFVSRYFLTPEEERAFVEEHKSYAAITLTGTKDMDRSPEGREPALVEMREALIEACDALICIGGRLHEGGQIVPGVKREFELARTKRIPIYLVGTGGGATRKLFEEELRRDGSALCNGLTPKENEDLATNADPWTAARLIAKDLENLCVARRAKTELPDIEHLKLIQGVITRLAGNSFSIKGWSITLVAALLAFAAKNRGYWYALITLVPVFFFWGLDAYYLSLERLFRKLYELVLVEAAKPVPARRIKPFELNPGALPKDMAKNLDPWWKIAGKRGAVIGFHLPLLVVVLAMLVLTASGILQPEPEPARPAASTSPAQPGASPAGGPNSGRAP